MKEKLDIKKSSIIIAALVLGFLLVAQVVVVKKNLALTKQDNLMNIAYGIVEISNSIFELQNEYNDLRAKNDSFSFDVKDKTKMKDNIEAKISSYKSINGASAVSGRGVEIKVEGGMLTEEIVDLINGVRNAKPQAIAINGKRVVYSSYFIVGNDGKLEFDGQKSDFPVNIDVVGDPDSLEKSLNRPGGILDVLKNNSFGKLSFSVARKDALTLGAYEGKTDFRYAKNTSY